MSVQEELDQLLFLVSDQSLTLLPEYHQRIKVSAQIDFIIKVIHSFKSFIDNRHVSLIKKAIKKSIN